MATEGLVAGVIGAVGSRSNGLADESVVGVVKDGTGVGGLTRAAMCRGPGDALRSIEGDLGGTAGFISVCPSGTSDLVSSLRTGLGFGGGLRMGERGRTWAAEEP
jgi:hypothetical protein